MIWNERASPRPTRCGIERERDVLTGEQDRSGIRAKGAGDLVNQGRLARAVGADDGMQLAGSNGEADVVGDDESAVSLPQVAQFEQGLSHDAASAAGP